MFRIYCVVAASVPAIAIVYSVVDCALTHQHNEGLAAVKDRGVINTRPIRFGCAVDGNVYLKTSTFADGLDVVVNVI